MSEYRLCGVCRDPATRRNSQWTFFACERHAFISDALTKIGGYKKPPIREKPKATESPPGLF